jgi:DNA-binding LacI/PurR family transcriptional regulator
LVNQGFVERIQGRGTFVRANAPTITSNDIVAVLAPSEGDVWGDFIKALVQNLAAHDLHCLVADFAIKDDNQLGADILGKIRRLVSSEPAYMVVHGVSRFPFEILEGYQGRLIFTDCFESELQINADYVLADYYAGGRMVAEHLIAQGREKISIILPVKLKPWHKANKDCLNGVRDVFKEKGLSERCVRVAQNIKELKRILASPNRPQAVFCLADYLAGTVYNTARMLRLSIPDDLAVVGYYNTPWCQKYQPPLTSVSINEAEIAKKIVRIIIEDRPKQKIEIQPELVLRASSGPFE